MYHHHPTCRRAAATARKFVNQYPYPSIFQVIVCFTDLRSSCITFELTHVLLISAQPLPQGNAHNTRRAINSNFNDPTLPNHVISHVGVKDDPHAFRFIEHGFNSKGRDSLPYTPICMQRFFYINCTHSSGDKGLRIIQNSKQFLLCGQNCLHGASPACGRPVCTPTRRWPMRRSLRACTHSQACVCAHVRLTWSICMYTITLIFPLFKIGFLTPSSPGFKTWQLPIIF